MRIRFSEDEDFNNQAILWEANQERSLKGRKGQEALRRLEAALLALPEPKLIADAIEDANGLVCGLGAMAKHENYEGSLALPESPSENASDEEWNEYYSHEDSDAAAIERAMLALAESLDVPKLVAIGIIYENDDSYSAQTPEARYTKLLAWARSWLTKDRSIWTEKNMEGYIV